MKFKNIKSIIPAIASVLLLSSCLKDDNINQDFDNLKPMVGFLTSTPSGTGPNTTNVGIKAENAETTFEIEVNYLTDKANPGITIGLGVDAALVTELENTEKDEDGNGPTYVTLNANQFEIPATFTIPAGQQSAKIPIKFKPSLISPPGNLETAAKTYALPLKITSASNGAGVSGNFGKRIYLISIKNPYDGVYHSTGVFIHPTGGPRDIDEEKVVATTNPTTNQLFLADLRPSLMRIATDPVTNVVTVTSTAQALVPTPGKTSTYDPATKTFHLFYQYSGTGGFRVIEEDLEFLHE